MIYDVIIVGAGPAGMTSAIYTKRSGYRMLLLEQGMPGGQAATTDMIENYPGFPKGIAGPELMASFFEQAMNLGVELAAKRVTALDLSGKIKKVICGEEVLETRVLVLASGAEPKLLGAPGEGRYRGRGVSYCATCDGFFFKDKDVAVVGGGDSALQESLFLSKICRSVTLIHRRDTFRGAKVLQDRVMAQENIHLLLDSAVTEIQGDGEKVTGLVVESTRAGVAGQEFHAPRTLSVAGVFIFVGYSPNTEYIREENGLARNHVGYLETNGELMTNVPGVFAIGDVRVKNLRQVATAVGDGALVNVGIEHYLAEEDEACL